ncbi:hypothetical protein HanRHA438_Chr11g0531681 [Helianthus annuus]|nr:hypothetical protein HanRHA438_Chr11g0531681 [Helianthus annuus]
MGHLKGNCPQYLAKLKMNKANIIGTSSNTLIYVIDFSLFLATHGYLIPDVVSTSLMSCRSQKNGRN